MNPERKALFSPSEIMPISENSATNALRWALANLADSDSRAQKEVKLKHENKDLYLFMKGMVNLRMTTMMGTSNYDSYINSFLITNQAIQNQYIEKKKLPVNIDQITLTSYFYELLGDEKKQFEIDEIKRKNNILANNALSPSLLKAAIIRKTGSTDNLRNITLAFNINSHNQAVDFQHNESELTKALLSYESVKTFGPTEGLVYGALDAYGGFKKIEVGKSIERIMEKNVKLSLFGRGPLIES